MDLRARAGLGGGVSVSSTSMISSRSHTLTELDFTDLFLLLGQCTSPSCLFLFHPDFGVSGLDTLDSFFWLPVLPVGLVNLEDPDPEGIPDSRVSSVLALVCLPFIESVPVADSGSDWRPELSSASRFEIRGE